MDDITKSEAPVPDAVPPSSDPVSPSRREGAKKTSLSFGVVIGATVVIALLLIGVGYITYRGTNKKAAPLNAPTTNQTEAETLDRTSEVDEQTVDNEIKQIDDEMHNLNNAADFDGSELSDEELGL